MSARASFCLDKKIRKLEYFHEDLPKPAFVPLTELWIGGFRPCLTCLLQMQCSHEQHQKTNRSSGRKKRSVKIINFIVDL